MSIRNHLIYLLSLIIFSRASYEVVKLNLTSSYYCIDGDPPSIDEDINKHIKMGEVYDVFFRKKCLFKNICINKNEYKFQSHCVLEGSSIYLFRSKDDKQLDEPLSMATARCAMHDLYYIYDEFVPGNTRLITHRAVFVEG